MIASIVLMLLGLKPEYFFGTPGIDQWSFYPLQRQIRSIAMEELQNHRRLIYLRLAPKNSYDKLLKTTNDSL